MNPSEHRRDIVLGILALGVERITGGGRNVRMMGGIVAGGCRILSLPMLLLAVVLVTVKPFRTPLLTAVLPGISVPVKSLGNFRGGRALLAIVETGMEDLLMMGGVWGPMVAGSM